MSCTPYMPMSCQQNQNVSDFSASAAFANVNRYQLITSGSYIANKVDLLTYCRQLRNIECKKSMTQSDLIAFKKNQYINQVNPVTLRSNNRVCGGICFNKN